MGEIRLEAENLTVSFGPGLDAVRGVSFTVKSGECLGIVGESGSGKSVSFLAALGLLGKDARVGGQVHRPSRTAMIFQEPSRAFDPLCSIGKTFEETFRVRQPGLSKAECRRRAVDLMNEVHIPDAERRLVSYPHQFSGGMLQRVMIALALACEPEVLVADEPTTALDVTIQAKIVLLLKELMVQRNLSLVFISHDLALVSQIADRISVFYGGLVLESGPSAQVLSRPRSPYTRALMDALPVWGNRWDRQPLKPIPGTVPSISRTDPGCPFAPRCGRVQEVCRTDLPGWDQAGRDPQVGSLVRCFFPENSP